jgi:hypothetical protein
MVEAIPFKAHEENKKRLHQLASLVSKHLKPTDIHTDEWPILIHLAIIHSLGPMLLWIIKNSGMDSPFCNAWQPLVESAQQAAIADIHYEKNMCKINQAFISAHIPAVWLKGAGLAHTVYPQSCLRPMADIDILVYVDQAKAALDILLDMGYQLYHGPISFRPDNSADNEQAYLNHADDHHFHYFLTAGFPNSVAVELHFGLPAHSRNRLLTEKQMSWFMNQTCIFLQEDAQPCMTLSPEAHLLYLSAHNMLQHGESQTCLMRDLDVHLLITKNIMDWDVVINQAVVLGWTCAVARSLERASDFFITPIPNEIFKQLKELKPAYEDPTLLIQKRGQGQRWVGVKEQLSNLSRKKRIRYIFQNFFPKPAYMRSRYGVESHKSILLYYPYRWFDQSCEIVRSLNQRIKTPKGGKH